MISSILTTAMIHCRFAMIVKLKVLVVASTTMIVDI